jgi:hypothetical chaperone protein
MPHYIGVDFGTTNSVLAVCDDQGQVRTATYPVGGSRSDTFRTALCLWQEGAKTQIAAGPYAIEEYLKDTEESRFIQSIKSYLASTTFTDTRIFNVRYTLEDLIALFLSDLWTRAADDLGLKDPLQSYALVSGRPVHFAGTNPNDAMAQERLAKAYGQAHAPQVTFAYEPEGAAYYFAHSLRQDARILVADFGGGTSDFSVVNATYSNNQVKLIPVAHSGVGVAGDILDFRLIDHVVSPALGKNSRYQSFGKWLDMPISYYRSFASWHLLSMLKTPKLLREIADIARTSDAPERVLNLHKMIEDELGYLLYRAVGQTKAALSSSDEAPFVFNAHGIRIDKKVKRKDFDSWIKPDVDRMASALDEVLSDAHTKPDEIDKVFMTGGTSFVPAVKRMISDRFGTHKIAAGGEFTSVGAGLALIARDRAQLA